MIRAALVLLLLVGTVTTVGAQSVEKLGKPYPLVVGELVALAVPQMLVVTGVSGHPLVTAYDKPSRTVAVYVYGSPYGSTVDAAKKALEKYRERLTDPVAKMIEAIYGVKLEDADFTLVYFSEGKEIVRREKGQYIIK